MHNDDGQLWLRLRRSFLSLKEANTSHLLPPTLLILK
nr:MAG TPA: hypothetical protein [Caudoviricetes sp.]